MSYVMMGPDMLGVEGVIHEVGAIHNNGAIYKVGAIYM